MATPGRLRAERLLQPRQIAGQVYKLILARTGWRDETVLTALGVRYDPERSWRYNYKLLWKVLDFDRNLDDWIFFCDMAGIGPPFAVVLWARRLCRHRPDLARYIGCTLARDERTHHQIKHKVAKLDRQRLLRFLNDQAPLALMSNR